MLTQVELSSSDIAPGQALVICLFAMLIYIPLGYMFDNWMYKRMTSEGAAAEAVDVHGFTVGPVAENCFFAARDGATTAIVVDPGDEPDA